MTTIPKRAIELAVQGGWGPIGFQYPTKIKMLIDGVRFTESLKGVRQVKGKRKIVPMSYYILFVEILLDPLFWQALGEELGWDMLSDRTSLSVDIFYGICKQEAHRLIDLILQNQDTAPFWKSLLAE